MAFDYELFDAFMGAFEGASGMQTARGIEWRRRKSAEAIDAARPKPRLVRSAPSLPVTGNEKPRRNRRPKLRIIPGGRGG